MNNKYFMINGQQISWKFRQRIINRYGKHQADVILWRCREKKKIINYISSGMKNGWFSVTSLEQDYTSNQSIIAWIDQTIHGFKPEPKPEVTVKGKMPDSIGDILAGIV